MSIKKEKPDRERWGMATALALFLAIAGAIFWAGKIDEKVSNLDDRLKRVENQMDNLSESQKRVQMLQALIVDEAKKVDILVSIPRGLGGNKNSAHLFDIEGEYFIPDIAEPFSLIIFLHPIAEPYFSAQVEGWPPKSLRSIKLDPSQKTWVFSPVYVGNTITHPNQRNFQMYAIAVPSNCVETLYLNLPKDNTGLPYLDQIGQINDYCKGAIISKPLTVTW